MPPMPAHIVAEMRELMGALQHASAAEINELRRTVAKNIPPFIVDMLIDAARTGKPLPPFPPPFPPPNRGRRSGPGPSQPEFF